MPPDQNKSWPDPFQPGPAPTPHRYVPPTFSEVGPLLLGASAVGSAGTAVLQALAWGLFDWPGLAITTAAVLILCGFAGAWALRARTDAQAR